MLNVHRNLTAYWGWGEGGWGVWRWGKREIIHLSLHCHHRHDSCIKMGSNESHFNVSLIVKGTKSQDSVHKPQLFLRERRAEAESSRGPSAYQPNALPLGQTGSLRTMAALFLSDACVGSLVKLVSYRRNSPKRY